MHFAFASSALTNPETNYSQIEKEGLSIQFAVKKTHQYILGHLFIIITDHKTLFQTVS